MSTTRTLLVMAMMVTSSIANGQTTWYVDDDNCPGPGTGAEVDPFCAIQAGIDAASDGDEVVVAPGEYFENINLMGKAITVRSTDPSDPAVVAATIIDANGAGSVITCDSGEGTDTVIDGVTVTGGTGTTCNPSETCGGGMYNDGSSPTVTNCAFSENSASFGGGMYNLSSSPTVTNSTFSGNTAVYDAGGMYNHLGSSPTVTNCAFSGNTTTYGHGGGMFNVYSSSPSVTLCTFSGNMADDFGGGMYSDNFSSPTVTNCILWGDSPDEIVNGINGTPTVSFSDVQGGLGAGTIDGGGNINADPLFVDADGDNLRLMFGSPCVDAADNTAVPGGITTDLDRNPRFVDDGNAPDCPQAPGTCGTPPIVDMGPYEAEFACAVQQDCDDEDVCTFDACASGQCTNDLTIYGDADFSGVVDLDDILCVITAFGGGSVPTPTSRRPARATASST